MIQPTTSAWHPRETQQIIPASAAHVGPKTNDNDKKNIGTLQSTYKNVGATIFFYQNTRSNWYQLVISLNISACFVLWGKNLLEVTGASQTTGLDRRSWYISSKIIPGLHSD